MKLTIGIKAYNEEKHIEKCVQSALEAVSQVGPGEVVLADSGSSDRTIEIARRYPIRIVQLAHPNERSAAAGAQLAFQHAEGKFFYMLDGDMVINPEFLAHGIRFLEANPEYAGVGGTIVECNATNPEFLARQASMLTKPWWQPGDVDRLDCGGLYRSDSVRQTGYFADKNLTVFEEFELGARLAGFGWKLARIDIKAADHYGHTIEAYNLLWTRMKTGYSSAPGRVLRSALVKPHLRFVLSRLGHLRNGGAVMIWWLALLAAFLTPAPFLSLAALILIPLLFLMWRRGSPSLGLYSLIAWNVTAIGILTGLCSRRRDPVLPLAFKELRSAPVTRQSAP